MAFVKAQKSQAKARVALIGPTGAGKTYTALVMATGMAKEIGKDARIVVLDTEHNSAAKYSDIFDFMVPETTMKDHSPASYVRAIEECEAEGFDIIIIDSLSHAWVGRGGALEMKDAFAARSKSGNTFQAWAQVTPQHNRLVDKIVSSKSHIIATMRSKMSYVQEKDDRGRTSIRKVGMAPIQRDGMEYEFDVIGDISREHTMVVDKTRWPAIDDFHGKVDEAFGVDLVKWLSDGKPATAMSAREEMRVLASSVSNKDFKAFMVECGASKIPSEWTDDDFVVALDRHRTNGFPEPKLPKKIAVN
tara:strand:- start:3737 stop:4648 length:912 start_codon:yes stop_codon:yes gene_type:complete